MQGNVPCKHRLFVLMAIGFSEEDEIVLQYIAGDQIRILTVFNFTSYYTAKNWHTCRKMNLL